MLKYCFVAALVLTALAVPVAARCETKAEMLLSGSGETPARDEFFNEYNRYFDDGGNLRSSGGMDFDLELGYQLGDSVHFSAGSFRNGFDGRSFYAGVGVEADLSPAITAGVELGAVTNYDADPRDSFRVSPTVIPYLRFGDEGETNLKLLAIPPVSDLTPGVIGFKLTMPLKPE